MPDRLTQIQDWRADLLTLCAWAVGIAALIFVLLCVAAVLSGWLRARRQRLHRKADHIGKGDQL